ncbi:glycosyltransferase family 1 protein [Chitinophaga sp. LS1]|uniref:glycosyltransferase family 4 protein n=1 Tax=Chitinophaga sp. LS1 TaxID=3051176 RepID=UPI002AAB6328|nr:glycosyltransferase family 1 protein [Chitinophaga sp. LS1]WPV68464.1 glycosyltransferase family 1 protein [Chitinophaga sp. LS1]
MPQLLFDCEKMKYPNTGLFEFCKQLGLALLNNKMADEEMVYYVPAQYTGYFGENATYIKKNSLHKHWMPTYFKPTIWHTTFQTSRYMPSTGRTKKVLTIHDLNCIHEKIHPKQIKRTLKAIQENINRADHVVTISQFVMNDVKTHLHLKDKSASVVLNGCHLEEYPDFNAPAYHPTKPFLFTIGGVNAKKNFHVLPALLVGNDYELIIAGPIFDDNYKQHILMTAQAHGVASRVKIIGAISYPDKYWYLRHCVGFLFPSIAEGFGLPVIEAMNLGKPCFLSDKTSLPEIGGPLSYYFHDFEPTTMQEVFRNGIQDYLKNNPSEAIKAYAAQLSYDNTAKNYLSIYRSLY